MTMRIVLCYPVEQRHLDQIREAAPDAEIINAGQEGIADELMGADIFCGHAKVPVPWEETVAQGRLQWIQSSAAGMDHCLVPSVIASDIPVTSASGLFADQVAEQTLALLLGLVRSLPVFFRATQIRDFTRRPTRDLTSMTVGIVGLGGNGRRIAEVLKPFRTRIIATDIFPQDQPDSVDELWPADQLDQLLAESDAVILCVPLNDQTHHMITARELGLMKRDAFLINVARGPVVAEADLARSLAEDELAGAGLDVTEIEPLPEDSPLWDLPNIIITPHVGAQSARRVDCSTALFCENIARFEQGKPLRNLVDKSLGFPRPEHRS